jgi:hypothetical protein
MEVYLICHDGQVMPCVFMLVHEADSWRIDGARLLPPWPPEMRSDDAIL